MDARTTEINGFESYQVRAPAQQRLALVCASPHSGQHYPPEFVAASRLDPLSLRRSEDSFVEEIFAAAPEEGAPLLHALFPRAYVDPNREPFELDPTMFEDRLPAYANTRSPRVAAGLGTIAKVVASGAPIYRDKLSFDEALTRIKQHYWPYHTALRQLIDQTKARFGYCILVDCHSMPSCGAPLDEATDLSEVDIVLGDAHGRACAAPVTRAAETCLAALGYKVVRNQPYSGGFVTRHYGRPGSGVHALQIEINRQLYMDECRIERGPRLTQLQEDMRRLIASLGDLALQDLAA